MNTKKLVSLGIIGSLVVAPTFAFTKVQEDAANYLGAKGVIQDHALEVAEYRLDDNITRREMLKVMMNLSGKDVPDTCSGEFSDIATSDWGCKYAEAALANSYIAANDTFRPDDNVTQIEALKMIMQARNIVKIEVSDWRAGYVQRAQTDGFLDDGYIDYDALGVRGWIFETASRSYSDFVSVPSDYDLTAEEEELFKLLNIITD